MASTKAGGRPTVIDEMVIRKLKLAFEHDCTIEEACAYAKISESTFYQKKAEDPEFMEIMERARQMPFLIAKRSVLKSIKNGNGKLGLDYLKARQPKLYAEKTQYEIIDERSPVELQEREKYLRQRIALLEGRASNQPGDAREIIDGVTSPAHEGTPETVGTNDGGQEDTGLFGGEPNREDGVEHA